MSQSAFQSLRETFDTVLSDFNASPAIARLRSGSLGIEHYKAYLRETYYYTRENPQIQALATVFFRGSDREMVSLFMKHATSEIGHDQLALDDLAALGEDVGDIPRGFPLPNTTAFNADSARPA